MFNSSVKKSKKNPYIESFTKFLINITKLMNIPRKYILMIFIPIILYIFVILILSIFMFVIKHYTS